MGQSIFQNSKYTLRIVVEFGLSLGFLRRHVSTKFLNTSDQSPDGLRTGDSFCAMWYKALIAFMLK